MQLDKNTWQTFEKISVVNNEMPQVSATKPCGIIIDELELGRKHLLYYVSKWRKQS